MELQVNYEVNVNMKEFSPLKGEFKMKKDCTKLYFINEVSKLMIEQYPDLFDKSKRLVFLSGVSITAQDKYKHKTRTNVIDYLFDNDLGLSFKSNNSEEKPSKVKVYLDVNPSFKSLDKKLLEETFKFYFYFNVIKKYQKRTDKDFLAQTLRYEMMSCMEKFKARKTAFSENSLQIFQNYAKSLKVEDKDVKTSQTKDQDLKLRNLIEQLNQALKINDNMIFECLNEICSYLK